MTLKEAAKKANVNEMTVRRWIKAGKLKATKVQLNGIWHWHIDDEAQLSPEQPEPPQAATADKLARLEQKASLAAQEADYFKAERDRLASDNARLIEANLRLTQTLATITERMAAHIEQPQARPTGFLGMFKRHK